MERLERIPETLQQSQIGCIFGANLFSALIHLLRSNPSAGEATRGYLHGGLILDFVGQLGPIPKLRLLLLDLAILLFQLLLVRTIASKRHWDNQYQSYSRNPSISRSNIPTTEVTLQRQDDEEQGTIPTESRRVTTPPEISALQFVESNRSVAIRDNCEADGLNSGQKTLGPFWILEPVTEPLPSNQPTSTLSSLLSMDLRRREYTLNLPFRR
jgi:hypothetical protein